MTAVKAGEVERLLRSPPPDALLFLVYGPDLGRVAERVRVLIGGEASADPDPFRVVKLSGDDLADEPGRLLDEALSYGLFGSRRVVWVKSTSRNIAPAVAACLEAPIKDTLVVIEAGDLPRSSPLRAVCERSARALAVPCYPDETRDLGTVLDEMLRTESLSIDRDARELLLASLGGDRLATRSELAKLSLFVRGRSRISLDDVLAAVSDVSGVHLDDMIDAAFAGDVAELDGRLSQLLQQGTSTGAILSAATRHALSLLNARHSVAEGEDVEAALRSWRGLHFRRKTSIQRQLRRWTPAALTRMIATLQTDTLLSRQASAFAPALVSRAMFQVAAADARTEPAGARRIADSSSS